MSCWIPDKNLKLTGGGDEYKNGNFNEKLSHNSHKQLRFIIIVNIVASCSSCIKIIFVIIIFTRMRDEKCCVKEGIRME